MISFRYRPKKKKISVSPYDTVDTVNDDLGILKLNQRIKGPFRRCLLNEFYIDCKKDQKLLKYFSEDVVNECLMAYKEWLISKLYPNLFQLNDNIINNEKKQMLSDLNLYIRMKYSSIRSNFQVPAKYYPALSKVNLLKLRGEMDAGEFDKSSIRKKAVEYGVTYYTMRNAIVNVLGYNFGTQDCLNRLRLQYETSDVMKLYLLKKLVLIDDDHTLIYIDESNFDSHKRQRKRWYHKARKAIPLDYGRVKSVNLIVALTNSEMVHYHQTYLKNNSASFIEFLKFLKKKVKKHEKLMEEWRNKKITLIMDNASIHKTRSVKDYIWRSGFNVLFLPPYHPDHNNAEFCFMMLKRMFYRKVYNGR